MNVAEWVAVGVIVIGVIIACTLLYRDDKKKRLREKQDRLEIMGDDLRNDKVVESEEPPSEDGAD